jgi:hypothetical protein
MEDRKGVYRVLVGEPEGKRTLGMARLRLEDNINTYLQEVGCGGMDWIDLAQDKDKVTGTCERDNKPSCSIKCGEFLAEKQLAS